MPGSSFRYTEKGIKQKWNALKFQEIPRLFKVSQAGSM